MGKYICDIHINNNFETITEGIVYKSGVIPPYELAVYVSKYNIKSIVNLHFPDITDLIDNPEIPIELRAEKEAIAKMKVMNYFINGSDQVPKQEKLDRFF
ncbi:hypothetical protein [Flavobacterium sp. W20_MBD1_R3]|uniref:hypothetical protein n=1 Tax=Flavobacterium sp. W20_MBD1_R3 TaxID=3240278 RepID=UPI003F8FC39C